ncbi:MAG: molybdopterin molybdotransferase MoeA [Thiotrichales bacterium]|jgi:molybdopterin molybdotransferase|nr:molybdopterin molybdotransferase MoeA [Thiotrichales bacterium]MBT3854595.1 molybdopterin molybdotransferase MoeA [Thiotrichales bacterium]MBT4654244.1 molybdopterin molybdotransferase MoeA [Thiotrichales bacterium]MBT5984863.1 molybdopterin molybdotransferase MoeA [Thiotrichales bacterium]MBT7149327.1 molybdopterin molybdotransferase MoeA [Thiotrichales bacterium]
MNNKMVQSSSVMFNDSLMSTDDALTLLFDSAIVSTQTEISSLDSSIGRILAKDIHSKINVPGFDNSSMDGYTIALDENNTSMTNQSFDVVDRITAGSTGNELKRGNAARIFTGAPIPPGANTVVMQEECQASDDGSQITIKRAINLKENIRPTGNDILKNDVILSAGKKIEPQDIALAASVGIAELEVFKKLKAGVFFTGDELVEPGKPLTPGKIYNSNRYALVALLNKAGCDVINLGNIKDNLDSTCNALERLSSECDLIITSGGVSVGEEDHVKPAVEKLGKLSLWRIKMKPGKPLAYGQVRNIPFIGLPGNPVSSFVTYCIFALPFIKKMQGNSNFKTETIKVKANFDCKRAKPRREFARVRIDYSSEIPLANLYPKQGSDVMSSIVWADGFIEIPENTTFENGTILNYYPLTELT